MPVHRGILISLLAHIGLIILMIIQVKLFSTPVIDLSQAIRVDMVGLPEKYDPQQKLDLDQTPNAQQKSFNQNETINEKEVKTPPQKIVEKPVEKVVEKTSAEPKKEPKKESETIQLNKAKQKQQEALNKLKKLNALEKIKQQLAQENSNSNKNNSEKQQTTRPALKGRILNKGASITGLDKIQSDEYLLKLDALIKSQWALPQWLVGKPLNTKILLKIEPNGQIAALKINVSSGNVTYDNYCLQAVQKAAPFPQVPDKFSIVYKEDGVQIGFPD